MCRVRYQRNYLRQRIDEVCSVAEEKVHSLGIVFCEVLTSNRH